LLFIGGLIMFARLFLFLSKLCTDYYHEVREMSNQMQAAQRQRTDNELDWLGSRNPESIHQPAQRLPIDEQPQLNYQRTPPEIIRQAYPGRVISRPIRHHVEDLNQMVGEEFFDHQTVRQNRFDSSMERKVIGMQRFMHRFISTLRKLYTDQDVEFKKVSRQLVSFQSDFEKLRNFPTELGRLKQDVDTCVFAQSQGLARVRIDLPMIIQDVLIAHPFLTNLHATVQRLETKLNQEPESRPTPPNVISSSCQTDNQTHSQGNLQPSSVHNSTPIPENSNHNEPSTPPSPVVQPQVSLSIQDVNVSTPHPVTLDNGRIQIFTPTPNLEPPKFDSNLTTAEQFLSELDLYMVQKAIRGDSRLAQLAFVFKTDSMQSLWWQRTRLRVKSWEEFQNEFKAFYGSESSRNASIEKLYSRRQQSAESFEKFALEMELMYYKVFPENRMDDKGVLKFIAERALPEIQGTLLAADPSDLTRLISLAKHIEGLVVKKKTEEPKKTFPFKKSFHFNKGKETNEAKGSDKEQVTSDQGTKGKGKPCAKCGNFGHHESKCYTKMKSPAKSQRSKSFKPTAAALKQTEEPESTQSVPTPTPTPKTPIQEN
jgi:hypothetical protein